jgi:hypothetical protein
MSVTWPVPQYGQRRNDRLWLRAARSTSFPVPAPASDYGARPSRAVGALGPTSLSPGAHVFFVIVRN